MSANNQVQPVSERIIQFNSKSKPELASLKYKFMAENAFTFFRGTCHIFYEDLSIADPLPPAPVTWNCGDLHIENFGSYRGDNRLVYFDLNDFDESILAPVLWDLVRMVTSIFLAFDALKITPKKASKAAEVFLNVFTSILSEGNARYIEPQTATGIVKKFLNAASGKKQKELIKKRTKLVKGKLLLDKGPGKHLKINKQLKKELIDNFIPWMKSNRALRDYIVNDVCYRISGTGSIGMERFLFLVQKERDAGKLMLIDMKQATASSLLPYSPVAQPVWKSEAERIIAVQTRMQNISPSQLSPNIFRGHSFVMQEMQPTKDRINFGLIENDFKKISCVMQDMAVINASAYLNSCGRQGSCNADDLIVFAQNTQWHQAVTVYALEYTKKVVDDFKSFRSDYINGLIL